MSYDVNPIRQPLIQNSQRMQNDGGGGNLGYMQQGGKNKDKEEEQQQSLLEKDEQDILQLDSNSDDFKEDEEEGTVDAKKWFISVVDKFKSKSAPKSQNPFKDMEITGDNP